MCGGQGPSRPGGLEGLGRRPLEDNPWKARIGEPGQNGRPNWPNWRGEEAARETVIDNRARLKFGVACAGLRLRAEIVGRPLAHILDRGGLRRTRLRGCKNTHKHHLLHVAGHTLSLPMRQPIGRPREADMATSSCCPRRLGPR